MLGNEVERHGQADPAVQQEQAPADLQAVQAHAATQSVEDAQGRKTEYTYDQHSNLLSVVDPLQHRSSLTYDGAGLVTSATDQLGHTQTFKYNQLGFLKEMTLPPDGQGLPEATSFSAHFRFSALGGKVLMKWSCGMPHLSTTILRISRS